MMPVPDLGILRVTGVDAMAAALKLHAVAVPLLSAGRRPEQVLSAVLRECPEAISDLPATVFADATRLGAFLTPSTDRDELN